MSTPPEAQRPPSLAMGGAAEILRRLELLITRRLDGLLQGDYRGLVPGHGSELGETRPYQPGDDVRRIDWNVTARTLETHVRETIADRELETWVLIDTSASISFGTAECEKRDLVLAALAAVGFLTQRSGNRIGAMLLGSGGDQIIRARSGRAHLQQLLQRSFDGLTSGETGTVDLAAGLARLGGVTRRRGMVVVISDFLDASDWQRPLRALAMRHEALTVEVVDPRELALPNVGLIDLMDPETGALVEVNTADAAVREQFGAAAAVQREQIATSIRSAGADHLVLRTDSDWLVELVRFVAWRRDRVDALMRAGR